MLFTQIDFLFVFLPITLIGYFVSARLTRAHIAPLLWLTAASLTFYAYWKISFLPVIVTSIVANYFLGRIIANQPRGGGRTAALIVAVAGNLLALAFFKYTNFG